MRRVSFTLVVCILMVTATGLSAVGEEPAAPLPGVSEPLVDSSAATVEAAFTSTKTDQSGVRLEVLEVVERFAPVLAFDGKPKGYPTDAQTFFEDWLTPKVEGGVLVWQVSAAVSASGAGNYDFSSLTEGDGVPTYFMVEEEPTTGALRIHYWWFYGWQHRCKIGSVSYASSDHVADWEWVSITTSPDRSRIDRMTFKQHGGRYTRSTVNGDDPEAALSGWIRDKDKRPFPWYPNADDPNRRPLVFAGRIAHGSYHWASSGTPSESCYYWKDPRLPTDEYWDTSANLIAVDPGNEHQSWMLAEAAEHDLTLTYPFNGQEYPVGTWAWGRDDGKPAVHDGPVKHLGTLWALDGRWAADCQNGASTTWLQTHACSKTQGWPAFVNLAIEPRQVAVPGGYHAQFRIDLEHLNMGGASGEIVGTQSAEYLEVVADLTPGLTWYGIGVGNDASCVFSGAQMTCDLRTIQYGNTETIILYAGIDGSVDATQRIDATVTWKARQQPLYSDSATASLKPYVCAGEPATHVGTEGDDDLIGTDDRDVIIALGGNDTIDAKGGNDLVCAGPGSDVIRGGTGKDVIYGQGGKDLIRGGSNGDTLKGGTSGDTIYGGTGHDLIFGGSGRDQIFANSGNDTVKAGKHNDTVAGGKGDDTLKGQSGSDYLKGQSGDDTLHGGPGADQLDGGPGTDSCTSGTKTACE